jgi:hypothetical protein
VIGFILCRTKSLVCKDAFHKESTIQKYFRDSALLTSQKNWFPVSRPDDVSSRPDAHLSIVPFVQTPDRSSIIHPDDVNFRPDSSLYREASVPACIRLDDSAARSDDVQ